MTDRVWTGGEGDWSDPSRWMAADTDAAGAPVAGDTATVATGAVDIDGPEGLNGSTFNAVALRLGDAAGDPALLQLSSAYLERYFSVAAEGSATIESDGVSAIACAVASGGAGTVLTLDGDPSVRDGLLLTQGGSLAVQAGATLQLGGRITDEGTFAIRAAAGSTVNNDAAVKIVGPFVDIAGALTGTGSFRLGSVTTLSAEGSVSSGQTIRFGDTGARLEIADPNAFAGTITGFRPGDLLDMTSVVAASARYDAAAGTLTLADASGQALTTLRNVAAAPGALRVADDGQGGTTVSYANAPTRLPFEIDDGDRAMGSNVARRTELAPTTGAPVDGSGVKVGIISGSFDAVNPGAADVDAAAGYLPANPDGTSAVTVLKEGPSTSDDEGRAMAELVHQAAPGAELYFASAGSSQADFAASVRALQAAGCQVITDDITWFAAPDYQVDGAAADAEAQAVAAGVSVFTSAGNYGQAFLEQPFTPQATTLPDGTSAQAEVFSDGAPTDTITVPGGDHSRLDLQWTAPFEGQNDRGAPDALGLAVFDASGRRVSTGSVVTQSGIATTDVYASLPVEAASTNYRVAVTLNGRQVSPGAFKLILSNDGSGGTGPGGYFHDPAAGQGSGDLRGQQLVPGVNTVGESDFANSAAFGLDPTYDVGDSDQGPGTLLYDAQGDALPAPQAAGKVDFDAPSGISTSVTGFVPFFGTSAAAPDAAAVAALMLQANPDLTPAQVTAILQATAADQGLPAAVQGAGLVQAQGAVAAAIASGQSTADRVSFDSGLTPDGSGGFVVTGRASGPAGIAAVEITALVGGVREDLGAATLAADGTFTFDDAAGAGRQGFITATAVDRAGGYAQGLAPFSLAEGFGGRFDASATAYDAAGDATSTAAYRSDGSRVLSVLASGQTFDSTGPDTIRNGGAPENTFVFEQGHGLGVVTLFRAGGTDHDVLSFAGADFDNSVAEVLRHTRNAGGAAVIADPVTGDVVRLAGVTKAQLAGQAGDIAFHV